MFVLLLFDCTHIWLQKASIYEIKYLPRIQWWLPILIWDMSFLDVCVASFSLFLRHVSRSKTNQITGKFLQHPDMDTCGLLDLQFYRSVQSLYCSISMSGFKTNAEQKNSCKLYTLLTVWIDLFTFFFHQSISEYHEATLMMINNSTHTAFSFYLFIIESVHTKRDKRKGSGFRCPLRYILRHIQGFLSCELKVPYHIFHSQLSAAHLVVVLSSLRNRLLTNCKQDFSILHNATAFFY